MATDGLALKLLNLSSAWKAQSRADFHSWKRCTVRPRHHEYGLHDTFLSISHSMAHKISAQFHTIHGRTNAICFHTLSMVHAQLRQLHGLDTKLLPCRWKIPDRSVLGLPCSTQKPLKSLRRAVYELGERCGSQMNFKAQGIDEKNGRNIFSWIGLPLAYEDQCSPANPRLQW